MAPTINQAGFDLITAYEGCDLCAYQDAVGVWTIGYGHTGPDVHAGMIITQSRADALLRADLARFESCIDNAIDRSLTPNQYAACVSLAYNIGCAAFGGSTVLRCINAGDFGGAADAFGLWVDGANGVVLEGLVRRRAAERALFVTP